MVELGARITLASVLAVAVLAKVRRPERYAAFVSSIRELQFVPFPAVVAPLVVAAELTTAGVLVTGRYPEEAFCGAAILMATFCLVISTALHRGAMAQCNCFGADGEQLGVTHMIRNVLLIGIAAGGAIAAHNLHGASHVSPGAAVGSCLVGGVLGTLFARWEDTSYAAVPLVLRAGRT